MSETWINIRFGKYHFKLMLGSWLEARITKNDYWSKRWYKNPIAIYDFSPLSNLRWIKGHKE